MPSFIIRVSLLILILYTLYVKSSPVTTPQHILKGPRAGQVINTSRLVLKLDCPECPNVDASSRGAASSIIYDFSITTHYPPTIIWTPTHPELPALKSEHPFFPPPAPSNSSSEAPHPLLFIPSSFSLDAYVADPTPWTNYSMRAGAIDSVVIPTTSPWNVTRVSFHPSTFEDIPVAVIYLLNSRSGKRATRKQMRFVWWELVPAVEFFEDAEKARPTPRPDHPLPAGLVAKLGWIATEGNEQQLGWVG